MSVEDQLQDAANKATQASAQANAWAFGPENTTVPTDSGPVPTIAEFTRSNQAVIDTQLNGMGYTRVGTFATGATLNNSRQTLLWEVSSGGDGQEYGWTGVFPKIVPPASTPGSTGGISTGAWVSRFDPELRTALTTLSGVLNPAASWLDIPKHGDPDLGDELDAQSQALSARSEWLRTLLEYGSNLRQSDAAAMFSLLRTDGLVFVVLGDSTEAGVGGGSGSSSYGECAGLLNQASGNLLAYSLIHADPNFVKARASAAPTQPSYTNPSATFLLGSSPLENWQVRKSLATDFDLLIRQKRSSSTNEVTVYYQERTADNAATFRVRVFNSSGTQIGTQVIDSYTPAITYGSAGTFAVQGRIAKATIALSESTRVMTVRFDQPETVDRGSGVSEDGAAMIFGVTGGRGIAFRNFAVSSTTLLDNSDANASRGVTTSERLAKAQAFGANAFMIGWGTNDSKDGVNTIEQFTDDYYALIDSIRATAPGAVVILCTDPAGRGDPYENNTVYNAAVRRIASDKKCSVFDVEQLFLSLTPEIVYADLVHPSLSGYDAIHDGLCSSLGINSWRSSEAPLTAENSSTRTGKLVLDEPASDFSGGLVTIAEQVINRIGDCDLCVRVKLNIARAGADFNLSLFKLKLTAYTGMAGGGNALSTAVIDETAVSAAQVGGVAVATVVMNAIHIFSNASSASVKLTIEGQNWQLRSADAMSQIDWMWIPRAN